MPIYKAEEIFGWINDQEKFVCRDCFEDGENNDAENWIPVERKEDSIYVCDVCNHGV
jgi:hypothetical protein